MLDFNKSSNCLDIYPKNTQISNLIIVLLVSSEVLHSGIWTDRQTGRQTFGHNEDNRCISQFRELDKKFPSVIRTKRNATYKRLSINGVSGNNHC